MKRVCKALWLILALGLAGLGMAEQKIPAGYRSAVSAQGFSAAIFYAMALTESGQSEMTADYRPWPWTLSIDREAHFYRDRAAAAEALRSAIADEAEQLGVGLFQIEYRFHAHRFDAVDDMLDPYRNSQVAAEIFSEGLRQAGGDVWQAVGLFHSATPEHADAYRQRVAERLFNLLGRAG